MSLVTDGIYSTISPPLSGAMEDCSIVRVQQLQVTYRRRCFMSASGRMFLHNHRWLAYSPHSSNPHLAVKLYDIRQT